MTTTTLDPKIVQEQVLQAVKQAQDLTLDAVRAVADVVAPLYGPVLGRLPKLPFGDKLPDPEKTVESSYSFVDQLVATQKDFSLQLIKVMGSQRDGGQD
ncbi:MAG: hypothetical protein QOG64_1119 [Acidimicrobiaceae bacterium]|jgi:hypothetical protein|nr:hypothetical protein [Acidimicrobiaceae bacterium]